MTSERFGMVVVLMALAVTAGAAERGAITDFDEGSVLVPARTAPGTPVLVVHEFPRRYKQVVKMLQAGAAAGGLTIIAPKLVLKNGRTLDPAQAAKQTEALLGRLAAFQCKPGQRFAMAFSASGPLGYAAAFSAPKAFSGVVIVASTPPTTGAKTLARGKALPVLLVHGDADAAFGPARGEQARKALAASGVKATLHVLEGADHMGTLTQGAAVIAAWAAKLARPKK